MGLQTLLDQKKMTKYQLSKISGVPKTTINDICSGKSAIEKCAAKTVRQIANALDCSMETVMDSELTHGYDANTGLPIDKSYFECGLPIFLEESLRNMKTALAKQDAGECGIFFEAAYCTLQSDINVAEVGQLISEERAWYLREKYLGLRRVSEYDD